MQNAQIKDSINSKTDFAIGASFLGQAKGALVEIFPELDFAETVASFETDRDLFAAYLEDNTIQSPDNIMLKSVAGHAWDADVINKLKDAECVKVYLSSRLYCTLYQILAEEEL
jgi:hypothetical protein